jgi:ketosteroid isomerase-like protein
MKMHVKNWEIWSAFAVLTACACGGIESTDYEQQIMAADSAFSAATAEAGVDGWVSYFAENGIQFRNGGIVSGHTSIRDLMAPAFADSTYSLTWDPVLAEVSKSGDLGYTVGQYESRRLGPDGEPIVVAGSYVTIWRREADGAWKVALDIGNPVEQ